jgi:hypothetical protein
MTNKLKEDKMIKKRERERGAKINIME